MTEGKEVFKTLFSLQRPDLLGYFYCPRELSSTGGGGAGNQESLDYGFTLSHLLNKPLSLVNVVHFQAFLWHCKPLFHITYVLLFGTLGKEEEFVSIHSLSHTENGCVKQLCGNCGHSTEGVKNIPLLSQPL